MALPVNQISIFVFIKYWVSYWIHLKITKNVLNVELSEWENLRDLIILQMSGLENLSTILINDVSIEIDEVTLFVDKSTLFVHELSFVILLLNHFTLGIFINLSDHIIDVEPPSIIIKQFGQVSISSHLGLVELLTAIVIDQVSIFINSIASLAHSVSSFVYKASL